MFKWLAMLAGLVLIAGCMGAMGIGEVAMLEFVLAFCLMSFTAVLLAWLFLREHSSGKDPEAEPHDFSIGSAAGGGDYTQSGTSPHRHE